MPLKPYRRIDRPFSEIAKEIRELKLEFELVESGQYSQRKVLCNKWRSYWLLTEILQKVQPNENS